jgi:hypothetical protein
VNGTTPERPEGTPADARRNRRIDRIRDDGFVADLDALSIEELRRRRDECLAEREYLSMLRRLVQGRAEILQAELTTRGADRVGPLIDRLAAILASDDHSVSSRGEAVRVGLPDDEALLARRRVERLVGDATLSDPQTLEDSKLAEVIEALASEEHKVSGARRDVIRALDALQDELKRRYRDDPTLALR